MTRLRNWFLASLLLASACVSIPPPPTPQPPPNGLIPVACIVHDINTQANIDGAVCTMASQAVITNADGYGFIGNVTPGDHTLDVADEGYVPYHGVYTITAASNLKVDLTPSVPPIPAAPTRDEALNIQSHDMQGLVCHTDQFGDLHWWGAAIAWLNSSDRQLIYACKHVVNDTHMIVQLPAGKPLYDECCNDYSPDRFGPLDWRSGDSSFDNRLPDLVAEIRRAGFIPIVFPDELPANSYSQIAAAILTLQHSSYGDISQQVGIYMIGWDGVFYGPWTRAQVEGWPVQVRLLCPLCQFGLEFNTGHIPQEAGWNMSGFDALMIEFDRSVHTNNNWCIAPRLFGWDRFIKPADYACPDYGGGPLPRMPMQTPRGEIQTVCFESKTYWFVRNQDTVADIENDRQYLIAEGCPAID